MRRFDLVELCAGTAAVSLRALGAPVFPVSRIGSKSGYAPVILDKLRLQPGTARRVCLVEHDRRIAQVLYALFSPVSREMLADEIEAVLTASARQTWEQARRGKRASDALLWLAGARGGIGGFKGAHCLRPNVDGFIPNRTTLVQRVRAFSSVQGKVEVRCMDASVLDPHQIFPTRVYIDPPYLGRQGYGCVLQEPVEQLAMRWRDAGHLVVVSEGRPLAGGVAYDITEQRQGQCRRSLSTDNSEWLTVYEGTKRRR